MFYRVENQAEFMPTMNVISTLGLSTSRGNDDSIGQFGTGWKFAMALFARECLYTQMKFCFGKDVYNGIIIDEDGYDDRGNRVEIRKIGLKKQNGGVIDLNIHIGLGELDWTNIGMALREVVSNAIDSQEKFNGQPRSIEIEKVADNQLRAKDNYIRVYIPSTPEVDAYFADIFDHFICLKPDYKKNHVGILPKSEVGPAKFYRKGVFIGKFGRMSLFDYDMPNITVKESRIVDSYEAERCAGAAIIHSSDKYIAEYLKRMEDQDVWENKISKYYLNPNNYKYEDTPEKLETMKSNFKSAFRKVYGNSIVCQNNAELRVVENKGMSGVIITNSELRDVIAQCEIKTIDNVMDHNEKNGRMIVDALPQHVVALENVWTMLENYGMTCNKVKPSLRSFRRTELFDGQDAYAVYVFNDQEILMNCDHLDGIALYESIIHECAHHITGAIDATLPMQEFGFRLSAMQMLDMRK